MLRNRTRRIHWYIYEDPDDKAVVSDIVQSDVRTDLSDTEGGWSLAESPVISRDVQNDFDKATEELVGADYKAVALLSEQVVAGMNYCILCESTKVIPDAVSYYSFVYMYKDLEGNVSITDIKKF